MLALSLVGWSGWRRGLNRPVDSCVLDRVTGSTAAYSVRKIRLSYAGPCLRVQRSTDNAQQDIKFNEDGWLDETALLDFVGSGAGVGGFIVTWYDQSGNERHLTNSAGSAFRIVYEGVVANHEDITGSQSFANKWMNMAIEGITNSATGFSAFVACKAVADTQQNLFGISQNGADSDVLRVGMALNSSGGVDFYATRTDGTPVTLTAGEYTDGRHVHSVTYDPLTETAKLHMDGLETGKSHEFDSQGETFPETDPDSGMVGAYIHYETDSLVGRLFELILFDRVVLESERWALDYDMGQAFDIDVPEPETIYDSWEPFWFDEIPENATYAPIHVAGDDEPGIHWREDRNLAIDRCHYSYVRSTDPETNIYQVYQWGSRTQKDGDPFIPPVVGAQLLTQLPLRKGFTIPDATENYQPNNPFILRILGGGGTRFANCMTRPSVGGHAWAFMSNAGVTPNSHAGSNTAGGEYIREDFGPAANRRRHAWAVVLYGLKYFSTSGGGFEWPAKKADGTYNVPESADYYGGNDPNLKMGTWLAIPRHITAEEAGIVTPEWGVVFEDAKRCGARPVDNAGNYELNYMNATEDAGKLLKLSADHEADARRCFALLHRVVLPYVKPLDAVPGSTGAYSWARQLGDEYTGPLFRVRRSSDNTEQDINFDSNGALDVAELLDFCGAGNGFIRRLHDQSGNGRHWFQTDWANQPQIVSSGTLVTKNGKPAVSTNGTSHHMIHDAFIFAQGSATILAVASGPATASRHLLTESSTSATNPFCSFMRKGNSPGDQLSFTLRNDANEINPSTPAGTRVAWSSAQNLNQLSMTDSGTSMTSWVNNFSNGAAATYTRAATTVNRLTFGAVNINGTLGNFFDGHASEFLIYPALSTENRQILERNQKAYYQAG